jgi:nucleolar GTP-binding protein
MDISEQCGHTLEEQMKLFESIKPLFANKPLLIVLNKIDVVTIEELDADRKRVIDTLAEDKDIPIMTMSTVNDEGVMEVKTEACERLLGFRIEQKMKLKKVDNILNRLHVAVPEKRDEKVRAPHIPESVLVAKASKAAKAERKRLEKDIVAEMDDEYILDLKKNYLEIDEEERWDNIPEFMDGRNIADYIDEDIFEKLEELEREEGLRMEAGFYEPPTQNLDETLQEIRELARQIRTKRYLLRDTSRLNNTPGRPTIPRHKLPYTRDRKVHKLKEAMENLGVDMSGTDNANFTKNTLNLSRELGVPEPGTSIVLRTKKLTRDQTAVVRSTGQPLKRSLARSETGVRDKVVSFEIFVFHFCWKLILFSVLQMKAKTKLLAKQNIAKKVTKYTMKGEGDHFIGTKMPKHLFSGKRGAGKTERR